VFLILLHFMVSLPLCNSAVCDCTILTANSNAVITSPLSMSCSLTSFVIVWFWTASRFPLVAVLASCCCKSVSSAYFFLVSFSAVVLRWLSPLLLVIFLGLNVSHVRLLMLSCMISDPLFFDPSYAHNIYYPSVSRMLVLGVRRKLGI